ncbi:MAG: DUF1801 domain-containing protein [Roseiflexaceae bacterium]|nr:DUF1801 domain-containing protein [Roseiflexaceae bacterium]
MATLETFLESIPVERRDEMQRVWQAVQASAPAGYLETIGPKFLTLTADGEWYVALANQKNYISIYLMPIYVFPELRTKLYAGGRTFKGGKSCINFKRADDLPLDTIGEIVAATEAEQYVATVRAIRGAPRPTQR